MTNQQPSKWKQFAAIHLVLGILLWCAFLSYYSFASKKIDVCLIAIAAISALMTIRRYRRELSGPQRRILYGACAPVLLFAGLPTIWLIFATVTFLPIQFYRIELENQRVIQVTQSQDGDRTATVHFRPDGAYRSGRGMVWITLQSNRFPLIERELYLKTRSNLDVNVNDYMIWQSPDEIRVINEFDREGNPRSFAIRASMLPEFRWAYVVLAIYSGVLLLLLFGPPSRLAPAHTSQRDAPVSAGGL